MLQQTAPCRSWGSASSMATSFMCWMQGVRNGGKQHTWMPTWPMDLRPSSLVNRSTFVQLSVLLILNILLSCVYLCLVFWVAILGVLDKLSRISVQVCVTELDGERLPGMILVYTYVPKYEHLYWCCTHLDLHAVARAVPMWTVSVVGFCFEIRIKFATIEYLCTYVPCW